METWWTCRPQKRELDIPRALKDLLNTVETMEETFSILESRLEKVLRIDPPQPIEPTCQMITNGKPMPPLSHEIDSQTDRLRQIRRRLERMTDRLEI